MSILAVTGSVNQRLNRIVNYIGVAFMVAMMLLTVVDVLLRYLFRRPIAGSVEIVELMLVLVVFFGIGFTGLQKGHVKLGLLVDRLTEKARALITSVTTILSLVIFALIAWQSIVQAQWIQERNVVTGVWEIPHFYFLYIIAFGSALLCFVLLREFISCLSRNPLRLSFLAPGLVILLLILGIIWLDDLPQMSPLAFAAYIGVPLLLLLLFAGMPVGFTMAFVGFLGMSYLRGIDAGLQVLRSAPFHTTSSYVFSVIPLFIFMGMIAFSTKISRDLYDTAYKWIGSLPGGLAQASVVACAGFAAICGDSLATALAMGTTALPEMRRYKYAPGLATGSIAAAGTLGVLIPPSLVFILYALLTEQSVGELFIAGIIPGILLTALFMLYIYVRVRLNPKLGPPGPTVSAKDKLVSTWSTWPVLLLFLLIIGGIYTGIFTPTEAGAIGAFSVLVLGLVRRRLTKQDFVSSLVESGKLVAMAFTILIGANILGYFLAASKLPMEMASFASALPLPPIAILVFILLIYTALGCLMPAIPMVILTVPIFYPSVMALGFDPIWFGVITVLMFETAVITPPVGINVFGLAGVAKDVPMETIFRGVSPFLLSILICIAILIAFPSIVTFLPAVLRGG
ncbi:hypothetical protein ES703_90254 [subsurface metagenome]